ncbi:MAG: hypothetical protein AB7T31_14980 [Gemmatimonadales bacterium]
MSGRAVDRRGDRRLEASRCNVEVSSGGVVGRCRGTLEELETGTVRCARCGSIDRRSTEGNRRRAELELAQLCRRIEGEIHGLSAKLDQELRLEKSERRREIDENTERLRQLDRDKAGMDLLRHVNGKADELRGRVAKLEDGASPERPQ